MPSRCRGTRAGTADLCQTRSDVLTPTLLQRDTVNSVDMPTLASSTSPPESAYPLALSTSTSWTQVTTGSPHSAQAPACDAPPSNDTLVLVALMHGDAIRFSQHPDTDLTNNAAPTTNDTSTQWPSSDLTAHDNAPPPLPTFGDLQAQLASLAKECADHWKIKDNCHMDYLFL